MFYIDKTYQRYMNIVYNLLFPFTLFELLLFNANVSFKTFNAITYFNNTELFLNNIEEKNITDID